MCDSCHVVCVGVEVKSLDALEAACKRLGFELRRGQTRYKWYGRWVNDYHEADAAYKHGIATEDYGHCDHAIHVPGAHYEVGVVAAKDGAGFQLIWDFVDGGLREALGGETAPRLIQAYAVEQARLTALQQGHTVNSETVPEDGTIELRVFLQE